jgi:hypothetical protein
MAEPPLAADLWGLRPNASRLEVTVPEKREGPPGVQVHRTRVLAPQDFTVHDGIPVTSVARTLLDLSAVVKAPDLATAIDRAERGRIFDLTAVVDCLDRAKGRRGAQALRRAIAAYEPSTQKSLLERRFKALLKTAPDVPPPPSMLQLRESRPLTKSTPSGRTKAWRSSSTASSSTAPAAIASATPPATPTSSWPATA